MVGALERRNLHKELVAAGGAARAADVARDESEARRPAEWDGPIGAESSSEGVAAAGSRLSSLDAQLDR